MEYIDEQRNPFVYGTYMRRDAKRNSIAKKEIS